MALTLQNPSRSRSVPAVAALRRWARAALSSPAVRSAAVTVRIVGAAEARRLNREFRGRDYATNVLSFTYSRDGGRLFGDLVLCAPVVRREAAAQHKPVAAHYAHLIVHGMLHLQGYDHEQQRAALQMERRERRVLAALGFGDPYSLQ